MSTGAVRFGRWLLPLFGVSLLLHGCSRAPEIARDSAPSAPPDLSKVREPVPKWEPRSRYGNPPSYVVFGKRYHVRDSSEGYVEQGIASWYGTKFHGQRTSSGEPYDMYQLTAAHRSLPLPTYARVTNLENGRTLVVKINDRGPFHDDRIIDLSYAAASKLGVLARGTARVEVRAITPGRTEPAVIRAATTVEETPAVQPAVAIPATPPTTTATEGAGGHFIQVGAFTDRDNAEKLRIRLLGPELPPVTIYPLEGPRTVYRVRVGPIASAEEAGRLAGELVTVHGIAETRVVTD